MKESVKAWLAGQFAGMEEDMIGPIYEEYRSTAKRLFEELAAKREAGEGFAILDRIAHTLKGSALMVGDQALFEAVQAWREAIRGGDVSAGDGLWPRIVSEVEAIA